MKITRSSLKRTFSFSWRDLLVSAALDQADDESTADVDESKTPSQSSLDAAKTAWVNLYPVELSYIAVPVRLDLMGADVRPLIHAGYTYYNALKPGYELGQTDTWYSGVDAKTGELLGDATSCSMCRRLIINAGICRVVIRRTPAEYAVVHVEDWIREDDSLPEGP